MAEGFKLRWVVATLLLLAFWGCGGVSATRAGQFHRAPEVSGYGFDDAADDGSESGALDSAKKGSPLAPAAEPLALGGGLAGVDAAAEQVPSDAATSAAEPNKRRALLIYTAELSMAVFEVEKALDAVERLTKEQGGYLVQRNDLGIVVRIPADRFDATVEALKPVGDILHRDIRVRDVTEQFSDLEVQLRTLEAMRVRFEQLLAKADEVKDALAIETELQRVIQEIERIKGKLKVLGELVAFSTITIQFEARQIDSVSSRVNLPFPWLQELGLPSLLDLGGAQ